ncbi:uncharacterized protein SCHCODRAFT_02602564 [Schizophyllum commune H4-8]|uniref:Uncharacterized protein n=1 Tax=Schizophyllum commune (strain H4-8 / FGSC 9210) TaxID=578458 RepID=D8QGI6_SCHCM|nr:uncharacterized protein SCHCODRAFT_02602564 [Schizophyllum commune H4-8]KAI5888084.1 hypothetical protein SCHCODRAFT_02602564 [Schizophyllum commune H4-8]
MLSRHERSWTALLVPFVASAGDILKAPCEKSPECRVSGAPVKTTQKGCSGMHEVPNSAVLLEVIELDRQLCIYINTFDMECNRIIRPLENLQRTILVVHTRELIIVLSDYTSLLVDIFSFQFDALGALRQFIDGEWDSAKTCTVLRYNRESTVVSLTRAVTAGCHVLDALSALERHIIKDLSYPPGIHFIIRLLGLDWNTRGLALRSVPKTIKAIFANVQAIVALVVRLKGCASDPQLGISVSILADIANMPQDRRMQVASLAKQIAWELYSLRRRARETADYIRDLATRKSTALDSTIITCTGNLFYQRSFQLQAPGARINHPFGVGLNADADGCLSQHLRRTLGPQSIRAIDLSAPQTPLVRWLTYLRRRSYFDALNLEARARCSDNDAAQLASKWDIALESFRKRKLDTSVTSLRPIRHANATSRSSIIPAAFGSLASVGETQDWLVAAEKLIQFRPISHVVVNFDADTPIATFHDTCIDVKRGLDLVLEVFDQVGPVGDKSKLAEVVKKPLLDLIDVERIMDELFTSTNYRQPITSESSAAFGAPNLEELLKDDTSLDIATIKRLLKDCGSKLNDTRDSFLSLPTAFSTDGVLGTITRRLRENLPKISVIIKAFSTITTGLGRLNTVTVALDSAQNVIDHGILDPTSTYNVNKAAVKAVQALTDAVLFHIDLYNEFKNVLNRAIDARGSNALDPATKTNILRAFDRFDPRVPSAPTVHVREECTRVLLTVGGRRAPLRSGEASMDATNAREMQLAGREDHERGSTPESTPV